MKSLKCEIGKVTKLYHREGFINGFKKIWKKAFRRIFPPKTIVYYFDLSNLETNTNHMPKHMALNRFDNIDEIPIPALEKLIEYQGTYKDKDEIINKLTKRYEAGAYLWMISLKNQYAGYIWSIRGKYVSSYYLPITKDEAVLFDAETFPDFRGLGLNFIARSYILFELKNEGVVRVYLTVQTWNSSSIKTISKGHAEILGIARLFNIFSKDVVLWYETKE